jgi:hypothetical protein
VIVDEGKRNRTDILRFIRARAGLIHGDVASSRTRHLWRSGSGPAVCPTTCGSPTSAICPA